MSINFLKDLNVFDEEEKVILNHLAIDMSKSSCCEQLSMVKNIVTDSDLADAFQRVFTKISDLSEEEWSDLQSILPYDVSFYDSDFDLTDALN